MAKQSMDGIATSMGYVYNQIALQQSAATRENAELKPLLTQKIWAMDQQIEILSREINGLMTKIGEQEKIVAERQLEVNQIYRTVMHEFYEEQNPLKLNELDALLKHFKGKEYQVIPKMKKTYGKTLNTSKLILAGVLDEASGKDDITEQLTGRRDDMYLEVAHLEEMLSKSTEQLESTKREMYFPEALGWQYKHGYAGIYFGMHDFWIEKLSGRLVFGLLNGVGSPRLLLRLEGSKAAAPSQQSGAVVSFRCETCGLVGEKGTKVPNLSPEQITVRAEFSLNVPVEFRPNLNTWKVSKEFKLRVITIERSIKGSIYVPKAILKVVLNRLLPGMVKKMVLENLPPEFGHYLQHVYNYNADPGQQPLHLDLDCCIVGQPHDISLLDVKLNKQEVPRKSGEFALNANSDANAKAKATLNRHDLALALLGLSSNQARTWIAVQKNMLDVNSQLAAERDKDSEVGNTWPPLMLTCSDMVRYYNTYHGDQSFYSDLLKMWQRAMDHFVTSAPATLDYVERVDVSKLFLKVRDLARKPVKTEFQLRNIHLHSSLEYLLKMVKDVLIRNAKELHAKRNSQAKARVIATKSLQQQVLDVTAWYESLLLPLALVKSHVGSLYTTLSGDGSNGMFEVTFQDLSFTGPCSLCIALYSDFYPPTELSCRTTVTSFGGYNIDVLLPTGHEHKYQMRKNESLLSLASDASYDSVSTPLDLQTGHGGLPLFRLVLKSAEVKLHLNMEAYLRLKLEEFKRHQQQRQQHAVVRAESSQVTVDTASRSLLLAADAAACSSLSSGSSPSADDFIQFLCHNRGDSSNASQRQVYLPLLKTTFQEGRPTTATVDSNGLNYELKLNCHPLTELRLAVKTIQVSGKMTLVHLYASDWIDYLIDRASSKEEKHVVVQPSAEEEDQVPANPNKFRPFQVAADKITKYLRSKELSFSTLFNIEMVVDHNPHNNNKTELALAALVVPGDPRPAIFFTNIFYLLDLLDDIRAVFDSFLE